MIRILNLLAVNVIDGYFFVSPSVATNAKTNE